MTVRTLSPRYGAKTRIASRIAQAFGSGYSRYIEPCVGGGAVLLAAIRSGCAREYFASDNDPMLILFYQELQANPDQTCERMTAECARFKAAPRDEQRARLNSWWQSSDPIERSLATRNTLMRSEHGSPSPCGISGLRALAALISRVHFECMDVRSIEAHSEYLVFVDPPYAGTGTASYESKNPVCDWQHLWRSEARVLLTYDRVPDGIAQHQILWSTELPMPRKRTATRTEILMENRPHGSI